MSQKKAPLFELIHSLEAFEKSYFKKFAIKSGNKKDSVFLRLFDAINKQKVYNESALKKKFQNENIVKNFAAAKTHLFNLIVQTIIETRQKDPKYKIVQKFMEALFLKEKNMNQEALRILEKIDQLSIQTDLQNFLAPILTFELGSNPLGIEHQPKRDSLIKRIEENIKWQQRRLQYVKLIEQAIVYRQQWGIPVRKKENIEKIELLLKKPITADRNSANSPVLKYLQSSLRTLYFTIIENDEGRFEENKWLYHFMSEQKDFSSIRKETYYLTYYNFISLACVSDDYSIEQLQELVDKFWTEFDDEDAKQLKNYKYQYSVYLLASFCSACLEKGNLSLALSEAKGLEQLFKYKKTKHKNQAFFVYRTMIKVHYLNNNKNESLRLVDQFLEEDDINQYPQEVAHLKLLRIVLHYELGNELYVFNSIRNFYRYLKKNDLLHPAEATILKFIRQLASLPKSDKKSYFKAFEKQLLLHEFKDELNHFSDYFDIINWTKEQIKS